VLSIQNIEAELCYAYLHAVAARSGFICEVSGRHSDAAGIDAMLRVADHALVDDSTLTSFPLEVQLKATSKPPAQRGDCLAYHDLPVHQYDRLRTRQTLIPRILVVLFLPRDQARWLVHTEECLQARQCAYWVSLRGALESANQHTQTVYLPRQNVLSMDGLRDVMIRISQEELIDYAG
jgi:hypothetical protein